MQVLEQIRDVRIARQAYAPADVGFVPTMGYLHAGHLHLVEQARRDNAHVIVSIFVNPTQFAPQEDLATYPRNMERDLQLLAEAGVDLVFAPPASAIYPDDYHTYIEVGGVTEMLEGAARPTFFRGVATVVCKLFNIVQPTRAYFGQKDYQQTVVVRQMTRDLNLPVEVVVCPTVRESDGLAMSSRNSYLSVTERRAAPVLYQALIAARRHYQQGAREAELLREVMRNMLATEPIAKPEYVSVADPQTLQELAQVGDQGAVLSLAVRIGPARLIDNMLLEPRPTETEHRLKGDPHDE